VVPHSEEAQALHSVQVQALDSEDRAQISVAQLEDQAQTLVLALLVAALISHQLEVVADMEAAAVEFKLHTAHPESTKQSNPKCASSPSCYNEIISYTHTTHNSKATKDIFEWSD